MAHTFKIPTSTQKIGFVFVLLRVGKKNANMPNTFSEQDEIIHRIIAVIAEVTNTDPSEMWQEAMLMEDLNMVEDSIKIVLKRLNQEFEIELNIPDIMSEAEDVTIQDLASYVDEEINLG